MIQLWGCDSGNYKEIKTDSNMPPGMFLILAILAISVSKVVGFTPILYEFETNKNYTLKVNNTIEYILQYNITYVSNRIRCILSVAHKYMFFSSKSPLGYGFIVRMLTLPLHLWS